MSRRLVLAGHIIRKREPMVTEVFIEANVDGVAYGGRQLYSRQMESQLHPQMRHAQRTLMLDMVFKRIERQATQ